MSLDDAFAAMGEAMTIAPATVTQPVSADRETPAATPSTLSEKEERNQRQPGEKQHTVEPHERDEEDGEEQCGVDGCAVCGAPAPNRCTRCRMVIQPTAAPPLHSCRRDAYSY